MKRTWLFLTLILGTTQLWGQDWRWEMDFGFRFDNREYANTSLSPSLTHFGITAAPRIGWTWSEGHSLLTGISLQQQFGQSDPALQTELQLYYQYEQADFQVQAGCFPSLKRSGDYPTAFLDEALFFDTTYEGLRLNWHYLPTGSLEFITDWYGYRNEFSRERFRLLIYGKQALYGSLYAAFPFMLHHYADSDRIRGVVDNIWIYPHIGMGLPAGALDLDLQLGWMKTFQNDRRQQKGYLNPGGFQTTLSLRWKSLGVRNTLYLGKNLLPYYAVNDASGSPYGTDLYFGNLFYRTTGGYYDAVEFSWEPNIDRRQLVHLQIRSVHHFTREGTAWQQLITLLVNFGAPFHP